MKGFLRGIGKERMHKKAVFYTYACPYKNSLFGKNHTISFANSPKNDVTECLTLINIFSSNQTNSKGCVQYNFMRLLIKF
jgi:hypothetical protein